MLYRREPVRNTGQECGCGPCGTVCPPISRFPPCPNRVGRMHHGLVGGGCIAYTLHDLFRRDACGGASNLRQLWSTVGRRHGPWLAIACRSCRAFSAVRPGISPEDRYPRPLAPDLASPAVSVLRAIFRLHLELSWWHKRHLKTSRIYRSRQRRAQPGPNEPAGTPVGSNAGNPQFLLDDVSMIDARGNRGRSANADHVPEPAVAPL